MDAYPHSPPTAADINIGTECILHGIQNTDSETDIATLKEKLNEKLFVLMFINVIRSRPALISAKSHVINWGVVLQAVPDPCVKVYFFCGTHIKVPLVIDCLVSQLDEFFELIHFS